MVRAPGAPTPDFHLHGLQVRKAEAWPARDPAVWFCFDSLGGCLLQAQNQKQASSGQGLGVLSMATSSCPLPPAWPGLRLGLPFCQILGDQAEQDTG